MLKQVYQELLSLQTEDINPATTDLDLMSPLEIVTAMNLEDATVAPAVSRVLPQIAQAAEMAAQSFRDGGRLIYIGAGTSGRLGVLDAAECPPTFGVPSGQVVGIIAGGKKALLCSIEGAEDDENGAQEELRRIEVNEKDTVCGITASRRTPYVKTALKFAKKCGAKTIFICCNPAPEDVEAEIIINPLTGPEALTGSTRLKAGTATKMVLNMISTTAMVLYGKTYKNFMVDLKPLSHKLRARSRLILSLALGIDYNEADDLLKKADGNVKAAIAMRIFSLSYEDALEWLERNQGRIRLKNK
jgi:N-acetylmuramic acid 6-phosphate etherase